MHYNSVLIFQFIQAVSNQSKCPEDPFSGFEEIMVKDKGLPPPPHTHTLLLHLLLSCLVLSYLVLCLSCLVLYCACVVLFCLS